MCGLVSLASLLPLLAQVFLPYLEFIEQKLVLKCFSGPTERVEASSSCS